MANANANGIFNPQVFPRVGFARFARRDRIIQFLSGNQLVKITVNIEFDIDICTEKNVEIDIDISHIVIGFLVVFFVRDAKNNQHPLFLYL